ncbi:MAG: hypothetical protein D6695_12310 [Planctomycetota bacterium]|nr:MAG: hypothetical protein D6695_12310 [Planctomycetota bacterium]
MFDIIAYICAGLAGVGLTICLWGWSLWRKRGKESLPTQHKLAAVALVIVLVMVGLIWWMAAASALPS